LAARSAKRIVEIGVELAIGSAIVSLHNLTQIRVFRKCERAPAAPE